MMAERYALTDRYAGRCLSISNGIVEIATWNAPLMLCGLLSETGEIMREPESAVRFFTNREATMMALKYNLLREDRIEKQDEEDT